MKVKTKIKKINNIPFYIAETEIKSNNAIILFPEAFGMTGHIQDVAHRLAREGFVVYVMQIYYNQQPDDFFHIKYDNKSQREKCISELKTENFISDFNNLKNYFEIYSKVSLIGFSIGGYLSLIAASIIKTDNVFAYYPNPTINNKNYNLIPINNFLNKIHSNIFLFFGGKDHSIPKPEINIIQEQLNSKADLTIYPNSSHGFFCNGRHTYNKIDAKASWKKLIEAIQTNINQ